MSARLRNRRTFVTRPLEIAAETAPTPFVYLRRRVPRGFRARARSPFAWRLSLRNLMRRPTVAEDLSLS